MKPAIAKLLQEQITSKNPKLEETIIDLIKRNEMSVHDILVHVETGSLNGSQIPATVINGVACAIWAGEKGLSENKGEAIKLFRFASNNSSNAAYNLAECYFDGDGIEENFELALKYLNRARALHFEDINTLSGLYLNLGKKFLAQHKYSEAADCFSKVSYDSTHYAEASEKFKQAIEKGKLAKHGLSFTNSFSMFIGAKNPNKQCLISHDRHRLTLHQRQALAERMIDTAFIGGTGQGTQQSIKFRYEKNHQLGEACNIQSHSLKRYNLAVANIGFVITDIPHNKPEHLRLFKTLPLQVPSPGSSSTSTTTDICTIYRHPHVNPQLIESNTKGKTNGSHSEPSLFSYLLDEQNIKSIIIKFKELYKIAESKNYKIYAVVIDIHSSYDICEECYKSAQNFQRKFRAKILTALEEDGFILPKNYPNLLLNETASGAFSTFLPNEQPDNRKFRLILNYSSQLGYIEGMPSKPPFDKIVMDRRMALGSAPEVPVDLRYSDRLLFFHSTAAYHGMWQPDSDPVGLGKGQIANQAKFEQWTAFCTDIIPKLLRLNFYTVNSYPEITAKQLLPNTDETTTVQPLVSSKSSTASATTTTSAASSSSSSTTTTKSSLN